MRSAEWLRKREIRKRKWVARLHYLSAKLHALAWIAGAVFVLYKSNFFRVIWTHDQTNHFYFGLSLLLFGGFLGMVTYATYLFQVNQDPDVVAPNLIPAAALTTCALFFTATAAFWPIWGWYTPGILVVLAMGFLMAGTLLPNSFIGLFATVSLFFLGIFSSRFIAHEGELH